MLIFPDTNFFLQARTPAELPWHKVTDDDVIRLMVCRTVQNEIDRFKGDGKGRRSERARKVSGWFAVVIRTGVPMVLREANPRVTLELAPRPDRSWTYPASLDMSRNDDRIVGEVLIHADDGAFLLTDDTGAMATARGEALPFIPTPDDWRLPAEPDAKDKQIAELQRKVTALERATPVLKAKATPPGSGPVTIRRTRYGPLSEATVAELREAILLRFPRKSDFSLEANAGSLRPHQASDHMGRGVMITQWEPPSTNAINAYQSKHAQWEMAIGLHLRRLHRLLTGPLKTAQVPWSVENAGTVPADGMMVEFEAFGGLHILDAAEVTRLRKRSAAFPKPPVPPIWKASPDFTPLTSAAAIWENLASINRMDHSKDVLQESLWLPPQGSTIRDAQTFYKRHRTGRVLSRQLAFECDDFRHGRRPEVFNIILLAPLNLKADVGAVRIRMSARNLPVPVEETVRVKLETSDGDTEEKARLLVSKILQTPDWRA